MPRLLVSDVRDRYATPAPSSQNQQLYDAIAGATYIHLKSLLKPFIIRLFETSSHL